ncbi:unnamed protein product [Rotaria sp. Silwood1]|nr:unnamed protein product [Rotaria sp. Silwood1]CAF1065325.1 unnamed protein product [Rotaria sp. Silwood1]CAF3408109.1 unnamed protein product [Rotaria sp. Silwood1]CAF4883611.1 unnamed protein product [Rotaria sp. Silwood1]
MSQPCAIENCKRASRALCHCCHQNLCRDHLNQHDDMLNAKLIPFTDEINQLDDRLRHIDVKYILEHTHEQLDQWRRESYRKIDEYIDDRKRKLTENINFQIHNASDGITRLKAIISQLIEKQDTTVDDLNAISRNIQSIRQEITQVEYKMIDLNISPLEIDHRLIRLGEEYVKHDFNLSTLMPPFHIINRSPESHKPVTTNNKVLLMHLQNQLCLFNQELQFIKGIPWNYAWIWDMCWSSTLSRFFIITRNEIFILDENTMTLECLQKEDNYSLCACTCSDISFYVATNEQSSSICEFSLLPTIKLIRRWQPTDLCQTNEMIQDMMFNRGTLAFIIENQTSQKKRMELRFAQTFEQIWCIQFDLIDPLHNVFRLCSFNYNEWLVIDWKSSHIFYVTKDGELKSTYIYDQVPYRCCQFGSNILVISAKNSVNFHKISNLNE